MNTVVTYRTTKRHLPALAGMQIIFYNYCETGQIVLSLQLYNHSMPK